MKRRSAVACTGLFLFLCAPLLAQRYMTTPSGVLNAEGPHSAYGMGGWPNMRIQQADNTHLNQAGAISQIAFRLDNRSHTYRTAMGRTWSSIKLVMSEQTNFKTMSSTFSANTGGSATTVFDRKWTWSTQVGFPLLKPDAWGGLKGQLQFPFAKPWGYSGKNSILADYTFSKGTLANGGTWTSNRGVYFYLDSEFINTSTSTGIVEPGIPPQCNDSAFSFTTGAYAYGLARSHGNRSPIISLRGKLTFTHLSYYTAPNAPVVHALCLGGSNFGVNVRANCNLLYVDFAKPALLMTFKTLPSRGYSGSMQWLVPWQASLANKDIWVQAAWLDSMTKVFSLTMVTHVTFPTRLPPDKLPEYKTVSGLTGTTGYGPDQTGSLFPYTRYTIR